MKKSARFLFSLFIFCACNEPDMTVAGNDSVPYKDIDRVYLYIRDGYDIGVDPKLDSVFVFEKQPDSLYGYSRTRKSAMKSTLADSIASLAYEMMTHPSGTTSKVSCYAGDYLRIVLQMGSAKYSVDYESIDDWKTATAQTEALHRLLKRNNLVK